MRKIKIADLKVGDQITLADGTDVTIKRFYIVGTQGRTDIGYDFRHPRGNFSQGTCRLMMPEYTTWTVGQHEEESE